MLGNEGLPNTKQEFLWPGLRPPLFVIGLLYGLYVGIELRRDDEFEDAATQQICSTGSLAVFDR
jgi:hypothetical protein